MLTLWFKFYNTFQQDNGMGILVFVFYACKTDSVENLGPVYATSFSYINGREAFSFGLPSTLSPYYLASNEVCCIRKLYSVYTVPFSHENIPMPFL